MNSECLLALSSVLYLFSVHLVFLFRDSAEFLFSYKLNLCTLLCPIQASTTRAVFGLCGWVPHRPECLSWHFSWYHHGSPQVMSGQIGASCMIGLLSQFCVFKSLKYDELYGVKSWSDHCHALEAPRCALLVEMLVWMIFSKRIHLCFWSRNIFVFYLNKSF